MCTGSTTLRSACSRSASSRWRSRSPGPLWTDRAVLHRILHAARAVRDGCSRNHSTRKLVHEKIGEHPTWHLAPGLFGCDSRRHDPHDLGRDGGVVSILLVARPLVPTTNASTRRRPPSKGSSQFLADLAVGTIGARGERYVPIFVGIFLFIWILNEFGVLFLKALGLPFGGSPTADLNTTAAFALSVFFGIQYPRDPQERDQAPTRICSSRICRSLPDQPHRRDRAAGRPRACASRSTSWPANCCCSSSRRSSSANVQVGPLNISVISAIAPDRDRVLQLPHRNDPGVRVHPPSIVYLSLATAEEH